MVGAAVDLRIEARARSNSLGAGAIKILQSVWLAYAVMRLACLLPEDFFGTVVEVGLGVAGALCDFVFTVGRRSVSQV